jgi:hypothetical protein
MICVLAPEAEKNGRGYLDLSWKIRNTAKTSITATIIKGNLSVKIVYLLWLFPLILFLHIFLK